MLTNWNCNILFIFSIALLVQGSKGQSSLLQVTYENGVNVQTDQELKPSETQNQPEIQWNGYSLDSFYTLIMYDPDAPNRKDPTGAPFLHWLLINIPSGEVNKGDILADYIGPAPPIDTGLHRYKFELYEQTSKLSFNGTFATNNSSNGRIRYDLSGFIESNNLGIAVASNQFQAQWEV